MLQATLTKADSHSAAPQGKVKASGLKPASPPSKQIHQVTLKDEHCLLGLINREPFTVGSLVLDTAFDVNLG